MRLFYTQEALDERAAAFRWYQEQRVGLGLFFLGYRPDCCKNTI